MIYFRLQKWSNVVFDVHFACVAVFNYINEDNIRAIVNQERSWFSFSKTSFEKQCHGGGGGGGVFELEQVASRTGQISSFRHAWFAPVANWHVLNVAKNGGTAKEYVRCLASRN